jgi:hypothetical protein
MRMIQCVSILILFQMKSMKVNGSLKNMTNKEIEHDEELIWMRSACSETREGRFGWAPARRRGEKENG